MRGLGLLATKLKNQHALILSRDRVSLSPPLSAWAWQRVSLHPLHVRPRLSNMSQLIRIRKHSLSPVWYVSTQDIRVFLLHFTQRRCCCHLGHTYCSSCVEKLIDDIDETSTCPECRNDFEFEDIRPLYLKPSNHTSGSQTSSRHDSTSDQDGYIKQAKHIARRLQRLNTNSPAESVKNAADVIEQVATIQCKPAQAPPSSHLILTMV